MALLDTQVGVLANQAMNYLVSGNPPRRMGNAHPNIVPYQVFPVTNGHVIIAVGNNAQFARLTSILAAPELASDKRFSTNADRVAHRGALAAALTMLTARWTRDDLLAALEREGVPAGPINSVAEVFADPQVVFRNMRIDAAGGGGSIPAVRSPIVIDGDPAASERAAPALGADTEAILADPAWTGGNEG
jgi:crotonobetainyl-CoA:carnitine CoA-transferase CaiB-like acyl-CoA transferase